MGRPKKLKIISRSEWGALEPDPNAALGPLEPYMRLIDRVCYNHTDTEECSDPVTCVNILKKRQKDDMECGFPDIVHNFIIGGDGQIYEGRGWDYITGTINFYHWKRTIDIGFIGVYNEGEPPAEQLELAQRIIKQGVTSNKIKDTYKIEWAETMKFNAFSVDIMKESPLITASMRNAIGKYLGVNFLEGITVVTREEWGAVIPKEDFDVGTLAPMSLPIVRVSLNFTASRVCYDKESCIKILQHVQENEMDVGYPDILYNFMIGADARIYEGRGWRTRPDGMFGKFRDRCLDIGFIGWFDDVDPYPIQIHLAQKLIQHGVANGLIIPEFIETWFRDEKF